MASALSQMLGKVSGSEPQQSSYDGEDGSHTLLVQQIGGSPWFLASDVPSALLAQQTSSILTRLGLVQIPLAVVLLLVLLGFIRAMMKRLSGLNDNILALSTGGADLTSACQPAPARNSTRWRRASTSLSPVCRG